MAANHNYINQAEYQIQIVYTVIVIVQCGALFAVAQFNYDQAVKTSFALH